MDTIDALARQLQTVLGPVADEAAQKSGFALRRSKLTGGLFMKTLVFGWLSNPDATLEELAQTAAAFGVRISPQGLDQRFGESAAQAARMVLERAAAMAVSEQRADLPLLSRFNGVYVLDSTTISLPQELEEVWPGCGGSTPASGASTLKLQVMLELKAGSINGPELSPARVQDRSSKLQARPLPAGSLRIADLGYFSLRRLAEMDREGACWLSKPSAQTVFTDPAGHKSGLAALLAEQSSDEIDMLVLAGSKAPVSCRLTGVRVPGHVGAERRRKLRRDARREGVTVSKRRLAAADWTVLITNAPQHLLPVPEALALYRARWQIELLFKLWKSKGKVGSWRSRKPWRILCEVYAKLLAMLVQHWALIASCWKYAGRSITKAAATVRRYAMILAWSMSGTARIGSALRLIRDSLATGCRINKRRKRPATYQLLATASSIMQDAAMAA